ncbi:hypothetical protein D6C92_08778 [Aureobasidium pullulans]|nr:hypothetical protein D6C92_08778 [Aureobasidium pullulans]
MHRRWNSIATDDIRHQGAMFSAIKSERSLHLQQQDYMVLWMVSARCTLFATSSVNIDDGFESQDFRSEDLFSSSSWQTPTSEANVGHAFVNFTHPEHITNFVNANIGKPWSLYSSTKRCEVSYATIQGIDCLLAKFRNRLATLSAAHHCRFWHAAP